MRRSAMIATIGGCSLFVLSLVLPAVEFKVLRGSLTFAGWEAMLASLSMFGEVVKYPKGILIGLAGLSNLVFPLAPWMMRRERARTSTVTYALAIILGFALAVVTPHLLGDYLPILLVGYFVWLLAYSLVAYAFVSRAFAQQTQHAAAHK